jgi:hypothetical protein
MSREYASNSAPDPSALEVRVERLERHERAAEVRREALRGDIFAVGYSLGAALAVVAALLIAQEQGWIAARSISQTSWVVTVALIGTVINSFFLLWIAFVSRGGERGGRIGRGKAASSSSAARDKKEYGSSAAAAG